MDCKDVVERLPWLLGGSLPPAEAEALRTHLAGCAACRAEMEETRRAAAVFGAHLPTSALVDLAWDRAPAVLDPSLARTHLEACASCREELDLARESRRLEGVDGTTDTRATRRAVPLRFVLPATLAAGLVAGFALGNRRTPVPPPDDGRVSRLEGETARLQTETGRLRDLVAALEKAAREVRPRVNLPLFELIAGATRGGGIGNEIAVPAGATEVVLLLGLPNAPGTPATVLLADAEGREVWTSEGLTSGPPGGYVVTLPAAMLPPGGYTITLRPRQEAPVEYRLRVRR